MTVNSDSNVVASTYIYIDPYEGELNVGDIVNLFGAPCRISLQEGSQMLLIYPKASFMFQSKESLRLRLDSQLVLVLLTGAEMGKTVCDPSWYSYIWQGFRAYPQQLR